MIFKKAVIILSAIAFFASGASSCTTSVWKPRPPVLNSEYNIFDTSSSTGTGLKLFGDTYLPRRCIKRADSSTTGGILTFDFIDPLSLVRRGPWESFIKNSLRRASQYNITGMEPLSVACIVSVKDRMNYVVDSTIELTGSAVEILEKKDITGFYRLCGTRFVDSTVFESAVAFVVTWYVPPEKRSRVKEKLKFGRYTDAADVRNLLIFDKMETDYPVFFSVSGVTDHMFIPVEFPVTSSYGIEVDRFLRQIVSACLSSSSGKTSSLQVKRWMDLPAVNRYMPAGTGRGFPEEIHDRVQSLERDMIEFSVSRINMSARGTGELNKKMNDISAEVNWGKFYKCSWGIIYNGYVSPENENDCKKLLSGFRDYRRINTYNFFSTGQDSRNKLNLDYYSDLRLIDRTTETAGSGSNESDYRFDDKTLYVNIPEGVTPGQTIDREGKVYSSDCIKKDSLSFKKNSDGALCSIRNDCYPVEFREWGIFKKIFLFWRKPPARRPLYRGNLEITGFSKELCDDFKITDDALKLAREDLLKFYKKYGTHYVSQIRERRGIVYYFSVGSEGDRDIRVESYGASSPPPGSIGGGEEGSLPGGCTASILKSLLKKKLSDPLMKPETAGSFFSTKKDFSGILRESSESVPVELYLKPWSEYLIARGVIRPDQAVPANLLRRGRDAEIDGEVSVTDSKGNKYTGAMSNGLKNGYGVLKTSSGSEYRGSWLGDLMHGRGVYKHRDGNVYSGEFKHGYPHGSGEYKRSNGNIYRGTVYRGRITGRGELRYRDGRVYNGEIRDGKPDGSGIMNFSDGRIEKGVFKKGYYQKK